MQRLCCVCITVDISNGCHGGLSRPYTSPHLFTDGGKKGKSLQCMTMISSKTIWQGINETNNLG